MDRAFIFTYSLYFGEPSLLWKVSNFFQGTRGQERCNGWNLTAALDLHDCSGVKVYLESIHTLEERLERELAKQDGESTTDWVNTEKFYQLVSGIARSLVADKCFRDTVGTDRDRTSADLS